MFKGVCDYPLTLICDQGSVTVDTMWDTLGAGRVDVLSVTNGPPQVNLPYMYAYQLFCSVAKYIHICIGNNMRWIEPLNVNVSL